jgi:hypothetical protein
MELKGVNNKETLTFFTKINALKERDDFSALAQHQGFGSVSGCISINLSAGSGSAFKLRIPIRIQEGKNDPQK